MNEQAYKRWQELHRHAAAGEPLSPADQFAYEAGCQELDAQEALDGDLERLRMLRAQILEADSVRERVRAREAALDARIAELEARLDMRTRQALGIGS